MEGLNKKAEDLSIYLTEEKALLKLDSSHKIAILGGHFLMKWQDEVYSDHLPKEYRSLDLETDDYLRYTLATWDASCRVAKQINSKLVVLVNDWQRMGLPENKSQRGEWEKKKIDILQSYYANTPELPMIMRHILENHSLEENSIEKSSNAKWMFSETELRNELVDSLSSKEISLSACQISIENDNDTKRYIIKNDDLPEFTGESQFVLAYGNSTNCAGEIVELLHSLASRGYTHFICLHPKSCQNYVNTGTVIFKQLYPSYSDFIVLNISIPLSIDINEIAVNKL